MFAERLRDEVDPAAPVELERALAQTVAPSRAVIWLRGDGEVRT